MERPRTQGAGRPPLQARTRRAGRGGKSCSRRTLFPARSTLGSRPAPGVATSQPAVRAAGGQAAGRCERKIGVTLTAVSARVVVALMDWRRISRRTRANVLRMSVLALGVYRNAGSRIDFMTPPWPSTVRCGAARRASVADGSGRRLARSPATGGADRCCDGLARGRCSGVAPAPPHGCKPLRRSLSAGMVRRARATAAAARSRRPCRRGARNARRLPACR